MAFLDSNNDIYFFTAPATDFCRGKSSSLIKKVHAENKDLVVIKNSKPYAVIISIERYQKLLEHFQEKGGNL